jgi:2'-5' RNA ligase
VRSGLFKRNARAGHANPNPVRAFLAIPVGLPALAEFQALRDGLTAELPSVRWTPRESPHITLHFFGSITDHDARRALDAVRPVCSAHPPLALRLAGLGAFPTNSRPSVLWCGVDGDLGSLGVLTVNCATALSAAGFPVDARPYRPHCTLGRPRHPWPGEGRARWLKLTGAGLQTSTFTADHARLYESVSTPDGVCHIPREELPLVGPSHTGKPKISAPRHEGM